MSFLGGALDVAGGIGGGILSSVTQQKAAKKAAKGQRRIHEEESATREMYSQMAQAEKGLAEQNLLAGEQARLNVLSSLGQPGTYGPGPGSTSGPISLSGLTPTGLTGLSRGPGGLSTTRVTKTGLVTPSDVKLKAKPAWKGQKEWEISGEVLNPEAMAEQVKGTAGFRMVSSMVAEAEQLMNRQGPLWNELNNSIVGGIYESNAAFQRDAMEQVARSMARGGTARRVGLQMAQAFQIQEQINRNRTGQLWQAKLSLEEYRNTFAKEAISYSQAWVNNHAGIRDAFTNALQNIQTYWSSTMAPTLVGATVEAQSATQQGILNASQGLLDAANTKGQAISGAIEGIVGLGKEALGSLVSSLTEESPYSSQGELAAGT